MATKQFTMDDRRAFRNRVLIRFDMFVKYKLPFPLDPVKDVYRRAFTDKEWVAMRYLQENRPHCLNNDKYFNVFWTDDMSGTTDCPHISLDLPKGTRFPKVPVELDKLPDREQGILRNWLTSINRLRSLREELDLRCRGVMGNPTGLGKMTTTRKRKDLDPCLNNPVQLNKLWPEVQPFMDSDWRRAVTVSTLRTRLPKYLGYRVKRPMSESVMVGAEKWATPEEFRCEDPHATETDKRRFREINDILMMMSLAKDIPDITNYPRVYGDLT